jgi:hypothetical protein
MPAVNELLQDAAIDHAVALQKYSNQAVAKIIAALNRTDPAIFAELLAKLQTMPADSFTVDRLENLLFGVRELNRAAYQRIERELSDDLRDLTVYEAEFQRQLFAHTLPPVAVNLVAAVSAEQVYAAAMARPFMGTLLRGALADIEAGRAKAIRQTIASGYVSGETTDQIVRKLRGTRALKYSDGIFNRSRRDVEAVVRTAVSHTAAFTRDRFYEANTAVVAAVMWLATLDLRTSSPCRARDRKRYTAVDHKPIGHALPWGGGPGAYHWNCRSTATAVAKSWRELGLDADDFTPSARASMDGQLPAETSYGDWLRRQSAARQDDVLGPTRGKLMRQGGLEMEDLYGGKGQYLPLEQLRERDAAAFRRAGL